MNDTPAAGPVEGTRPRFDPAAASTRRDATHRSVDLDPAPIHFRTNVSVAINFGQPIKPPSRRSPFSAKHDIGRMTVGQRRKYLRNLAIVALLKRCGMSQRDVATIFDLPHSRIAAIAAEFREPPSCPADDE